MTVRPESRLVEALIDIDRPRLGRLLVDSPEFQSSLETVARVLPVIVGALADDAARNAQRRDLAKYAPYGYRPSQPPAPLADVGRVRRVGHLG